MKIEATIIDLLYQKLIATMKKDPSGCWLNNTCMCQGYSSVRMMISKKRYRVYAHRLMYEVVKGPIPNGLTIDHLCRVRNCCNPDHLEAVTQSENVKRGTGIKILSEFHLTNPEDARARQKKATKVSQEIAKAKTHCKMGHKYTPETTQLSKEGWRTCKVCKRQTESNYYYKVNREKKLAQCKSRYERNKN